MNSSYKNNDINYGDLIEAITITIKPKIIIEIGILDGYSLTRFINATNQTTTKIFAYDIFDKFNGNHSNEDELKLRFKDYPQVEIGYGDFYELHKNLINNSIDIIHIDIANNGDIYEYAIQNYLSKITSSGIMILEGGSKIRDEVEWMNKYNKPKINPIIEKYSNDYSIHYSIKNIGNHPSITLISLPS